MRNGNNDQVCDCRQKERCSLITTDKNGDKGDNDERLVSKSVGQLFGLRSKRMGVRGRM